MAYTLPAGRQAPIPEPLRASPRPLAEPKPVVIPDRRELTASELIARDEQERVDRVARLSALRAEQTARQRRAMGI